MENSHTAVSTRKGFNYDDWFGLSMKNELSESFCIIIQSLQMLLDQNALQEQPHNTHKVSFVEKQCDSAMKNCSAL